MKQKTLCLFAACLMLSTTFAQTKREIIVEDPKLSPNLRFEFSPLDFRTGRPNSFAGASARLYYRANNKFAVMGEVRHEFSDYDDGVEPYAGMGFELTGTYFFSKKEEEYKQMFAVKSRPVGYNTVEVTIDPVTTTKLSLYGVRVGYGSDKGTFPCEADLSEIGNPSNKQIDASINPLETRSFLFGGLSMTRIKNIKVRYPVYGVRRKQISREYYVDILYGNNPKSPDFITDDKEDDGITENYQIDRYTDNRKMGLRVGMATNPTGRLINVGSGLELVMLPRGSFGFNIKFVLSIMKKVGLKEE